MLGLIQDYIYVFLDATNNQVTTKGVGLHHIRKAIKRTPRNIVLLSGPKETGLFDDYTRFETIRGEKNIINFFSEQNKLPEPNVTWLDYASQELFHQLTPGEISELLYLAHANRHLHSPFFYKLQNNYVCLPMGDGFVKMYYRYINEFYYQLISIIKDIIQEIKIEKRPFFSLRHVAVNIAMPTMEFMQKLRPLMYEGVLFDFTRISPSGDAIHIPIYLAEDQVTETINKINQSERIATLSYMQQTQQWQLETKFSTESLGG